MEARKGIQSRILRTIGFRERFAALIRKVPRGSHALHPSSFNAARFEVSELKAAGRSLVTIVPRGPETGRASPRRHVLLLHGGGYVMEAMAPHKWLTQRLSARGELRVSFYDYPLAPEKRAKEILAAALQAFELLATTYPRDEFLLFGDSAGGGLALALLQALRDRGEARRPRRTVLFSPWVDLAMDDPETVAMDLVDAALALDTMRYAASLFAGGLDLRDPRVSPLYGNQADLGRVAIFVSTEEIPYPACKRLARALAQAGATVDYHEKGGMVHDWIVTGLADADEALREIVAFYKAEG